MSEEISILDEIKKGRFEASLFATYNTYFPFYEEVVLPRLRNSGCRQNVVLMDAGQCAAMLATNSLRPRLAGREYSLIPIKAGGAFHPKLLFLLGKESGVLLVGSHNLTLAGFSHNRELTSRFEVSKGDDKQALATFQSAWEFVKAWAIELPAELLEALQGVGNIAAWLKQPADADVDYPFVASLPTGPSLWESVRGRVPEKVRRIVATGPYFDRELTFLKHLNDETKPQELVIGIDPKSALITARARQLLPKARFVSANCLRNGRGFLHAKVVLFEGTDGSEVLITGSANPSAPAWLDPPRSRNAEAVVIDTGSKRHSPAKDIGLKDLVRQPDLLDETWEEIEGREIKHSTFIHSGHSPLVAVVTEGGLKIDVSLLKRTVLFVTLLGNSGEELFKSEVEPTSQGELYVEVENSEALGRTALLELITEGGEPVLAIVHHHDEISDLAQTDRQKILKHALASLHTETPLIEDLMRVVEKVIFDDDPQVSVEGGGHAGGGRDVTDGDGIAQTSFAVDLRDVKRHKRHQARQISSGDLGALLDALIHRLGFGLDARIQAGAGQGYSEEELVGTDEEGLVHEKEIDNETLVATCQRKVKNLLKRMTKQLEHAASSNNRSLKAVAQLAAVLGLLQRLCELNSDEAEWIPRGETLVPTDARFKFFLDATRFLYSPQNTVMGSAVAKLNDVSCVEVSMVRGLLIWLAWDSDLHVDDVLDWEDAEDAKDNLAGLARLILMAPDLDGDADALRRADEAIKRSWPRYYLEDYDPTWFDDFRAWIGEMNESTQHPPRQSVVKRAPDVGDIVYPSKVSPTIFYVVIDAPNNNVKLVDIDNEKKPRTFVSSSVTIVKSATRD